uniref:Calpastatin n=1 Tax=Neogobius melanostomus TaxID=47308 RepID=A0A8C6UB57_9GOBI
MSLDALSALEDLLPSAEPPKPQPAVRPEDIVSEATVEEDKAVRVGERDDTLPPEYRPKPGEISKLPAPKPQPSLDDTEALDILSGDFSSSCAPSTQSALDTLSGDFVASSAAPTVQSSACAPDAPLAAGADSALDALSDSLKDIAPTPQPEPPMPTNIVKEKQLEEERLIKMGERDDTLPPEYRPTEEELMKMQEEKKKAPKSPKEKPMDDKTALDLLSGDFECPAPASSAPASSASAPVSSSASAPVSSSAPATDSDPQKPMSGKVLDSLSDTLLPDTLKRRRNRRSLQHRAPLTCSPLSSAQTSCPPPRARPRSTGHDECGGRRTSWAAKQMYFSKCGDCLFLM